MRRFLISVPCVIATGLAACSPAGEPKDPALAFRTDGATYVWSAAHGETGALLLGRPDMSGTEAAALVITCRGETSGGLRVGALIAEPVPVDLELTAGAVTLAVTPRRVLTGGRVALEGEGALPPGWFDALAETGPLNLQYGDQGLRLQGPGRALVEDLHRYCRQLDDRAG